MNIMFYVIFLTGEESVNEFTNFDEFLKFRAEIEEEGSGFREYTLLDNGLILDME